MTPASRVASLLAFVVSLLCATVTAAASAPVEGKDYVAVPLPQATVGTRIREQHA